MIINLEKIADKISDFIINKVDRSELDELEKAKFKYGMRLVCGVVIEFFVVMILSIIFKTFFYAFFIMLSSLLVRIFTGGSHCSSYDRCLILTLLFYLPVSVVVKELTTFLPQEYSYKILACVVAGISIQLFNLTSPGRKLILILDRLLQGKFMNNPVE
ncbi:MAG: accessory gene regulator B family protein [Thermosediminibacteraceae bacterium]|nr:accessory gene regulator B family protein [Thermosediminibacteraceae bacterium]